LLGKVWSARITLARMVLEFILREFYETLSAFNTVRKSALDLIYLIKREFPAALLTFIGNSLDWIQLWLGSH
jgi:hypothetical protein